MKRKVKVFMYAVAAIFLVGLMFRPFVIVPAGHRVVVFNLGKGVVPTQLDEGFHFLTPFVNSTATYDVRQQTYSMAKAAWEGEVGGDDSMRTPTSDGQQVFVDISLRFHVDPDNVWRLHKEIGRRYVDKIIRPEMRSRARIAISEYPAARVYSAERRTIEQTIEDRLRDTLKKNYIIVDEVLLRDVRFSEEFQNAIIAKQMAQQNAQRMKYVLDKERLEKDRKIILAQGEAEAIRLKGEAIAANTRVISYEYTRKVAPNIRTIITDGQRLPVLGMPAR